MKPKMKKRGKRKKLLEVSLIHILRPSLMTISLQVRDGRMGMKPF
jgi:hypothetical protein